MPATPCIHHEDCNADYSCLICKKDHCSECFHVSSGICHSCIYKGIILIMVIMVILSYIAWTALL